MNRREYTLTDSEYAEIKRLDAMDWEQAKSPMLDFWQMVCIRANCDFDSLRISNEPRRFSAKPLTNRERRAQQQKAFDAEHPDFGTSSSPYFKQRISSTHYGKGCLR